MNSVDRWFGPLASVIVVMAMACLAYYVGGQMQAGVFSWWTYPPFALLVGVVFTAYGVLSRKEA